jgi:hypothetical protein
MAMLTKPSAAAKMALAYITIGSLMVVWTGVYFVYLYHNPSPHESTYYICTALLLTGCTLLLIGLGLGRIGRAARHAELPPPEVTPTVAQTDQTAAATGAPSPENVQPGAPANRNNPPASLPVATPAQPVAAVPIAPRPVAAGTPFTPGR